ncbi:Oxoglutarate/iron-dependent oxygenase, partial [Metarhizium majus ARSEF 297]
MATITEKHQTTAVVTDNFTSIPILDFSQAQAAATKPHFLSKLREALVVVGFFYLKNHSVPKQVQNDFVDKSKALCSLPLEKKLKMDMVNSKHFLGYSRVGFEKTARITDKREIFDFLMPFKAPGPDDPVYLNVLGPSQWPDEEDVPGFRHATETYLESVGDLGRAMTHLVAEALGLEPFALDRFFLHELPRNKLSVVRYCAPEDLPSLDSTLDDVCHGDGGFQGVGPHKDGGFLTYLLQMTTHTGLEAQNKSGTWIPVPPMTGTFVINVGRSLESMTRGVCTATTHRVNLRPQYFYGEDGRHLGHRYTSPVFQTLNPTLTHEELTSLKLPKHITDLVKDEKVKSDAEAYFNKHFLDGPGKGTFIARLTSHPEVGQRWYPELLAQALQGQREFEG